MTVVLHLEDESSARLAWSEDSINFYLHALRGKSHNQFALHKSIDKLSSHFYPLSMPRTPKKMRCCAGCGDPLSSHKAGQAGKDCKGPRPGRFLGLPLCPAHYVAPPEKKEELEAATQEAEIKREEVAAAAVPLHPHPPSSGGTGALLPPAAGPPASGTTAPHHPSAALPPPGPGTAVPPKTDAGKHGSAVTTGSRRRYHGHPSAGRRAFRQGEQKFPALDFNKQTASAKSTGKTKSSTLSSEHLVFSCDSADAKNMTALPAWEARGRLALLQYTCHRLVRYPWPVVRAFHHAAVTRALRVPTECNMDWEDIKEYYIDGDASKLKNTTAVATSLQSTTNASGFQKNESTVPSPRLVITCSNKKKTGQRFRHPDATCHRKKFRDKKTKDDKKPSE
ncbi:hypothetical protein Bbelb_372630 [Branchiostoma belcheri]|nr:hypothetical protein Bbelb_372630 [Branchiostoma belcheri]